MTSDTRRQVIDSVDRFVRDRVAPRAAEMDATATFPRELYDEVAQLGVFGLWIPEEYGGIGPEMITPLLLPTTYTLRDT